jgi:hypothetical protein
MTNKAKTGGRVAGTPNRRTVASRRHLQELADPLDFLVRVMSGAIIDGVTPTLAERMTAARELRRVVVPDAKELPLTVQLPRLSGPADLPAVMSAVVSSVAGGVLTPGEGKAIADLLEAARKAFETADLAERVAVLESKL